MNSCSAAVNKRFTTWRWMAASDWRRRSRRGGKDAARATSPLQSFTFPPFQPDQETIGQQDQCGVSMEAMPQAALVLIPAQEALGFFMKLLDPVAAMRVLHHRPQRRVEQEVAPEVLPLARAPGGPLADQPADMPGAIAINTPTADAYEFGPQPTLTAFTPADGLPLPPGQGRQPIIR